ncbi:hypothetical protein ACIBEJ_00515 [Nonomuraea sp. NPDC050790]|uniref:hypothetical protein n=1 Tax=Nonomuraea sp. NPDC050790 TaxID=3364371 RepID=UPI00379B49FA
MDSEDVPGLLDLRGQERDWRAIAVLGFAEDDAALAEGYFDAAEIIVDAWKAGNHNDLLAIPILALYRHGIELALKAGIREAACRLRVDGHDDASLDPGAVDKRLAGTHCIGDLVVELTGYLDRLMLFSVKKLPADALEVLNSLHLLDKTGQAFRYATVKSGKGKAAVLVPARPDQKHVDILAVSAALHEAGGLVLYGVSGVLEEYAESQQMAYEERAQMEAEGWGI